MLMNNFNERLCTENYKILVEEEGNRKIFYVHGLKDSIL